MLHFALAGNILCAIGGTPKLYGEKYTPKYPIQIFNDNVQLNLRGTTKENLETFVKASVVILSHGYFLTCSTQVARETDDKDT